MRAPRADAAAAGRWPRRWPASSPWWSVLLGAVSLLPAALPAARGAPGAIYTCVDATGKRLTSDRPIVECNSREQRLLNADGSVRRVVRPDMTADERAEAEAAERRVQQERTARQDAVRRDRILLGRYPDEAAHRRAREAALADVRKSAQASGQRLAALMRERKPLLDEIEFYKGRTPPLRLQQALDANTASIEAQRSLVQYEQDETVRINALFDADLDRLRRLWAGAPPGSAALHAPASTARTGLPAPSPAQPLRAMQPR